MIVNGATMSEIKIVYKGESYETEIEDISPEDLQECFDLPKPPKFLLVENENKVVSSKHWKTKLRKGSICRIKEDTNTLYTSAQCNMDIKETATKFTEYDNSFRKVVLHSLIASNALIKLKHDENDEKSLKQYLHKQIENHNFEYIIRSKHGETFYLIAKELNVNRIYVAFRGREDLLDWKNSLQVRFFYIFFCFFSAVTMTSKVKQKGKILSLL